VLHQRHDILLQGNGKAPVSVKQVPEPTADQSVPSRNRIQRISASAFSLYRRTVFCKLQMSICLSRGAQGYSCFANSVWPNPIPSRSSRDIVNMCNC